MKHVLEWFYDVNPSGYGWGPVKVSYMEIEAFSRLRKLDIRPWEAELIVDLSVANVDVYYKKKNNPNMPQGYSPVNTVEGIKSMFSKIGK